MCGEGGKSKSNFSQDGKILALPQGGTTFGTRMVKAGGSSAHGVGGVAKLHRIFFPVGLFVIYMYDLVE